MAAIQPHDRVMEYSTSNSQTVFTVTGAVDTSNNAFSAFMSIGDTVLGGVVEDGVAFKSGKLTYSGLNQITVTTTLESKGTFSASGVKRVFMGQPALGAYAIADTTQSTSTATGALQTAGGAAVAKNLSVGGVVLTFQSSVTGAQIDNSGATAISVANGANAVISPANGSQGWMLFIMDTISFGGMGQYIIAGGLTPKLVAGAAQYIVGSAPGAGSVGVAWNGTAYSVYNNVGSTALFHCLLFRVG